MNISSYKTIGRWAAFLCVLLGSGLGCLANTTKVWVSIQPQKYFVEQVGGDSVSVEVLVRPGQSPEMYAPGAAQMAKLARAEVYFGIGVPIEGPLFRRMESSMRGVRIVQTGGLPAAGCLDHDHAGHDHSARDPHIWLDPLQMVSVVEMVRDALIEVDPAQAARFSENAAALTQRLHKLAADLEAQLKPYAGRAFFINHPALGHFAERFGLVQMSIEHAGASPSARRIAELVGAARVARVGAIFTQPEFGRSSATVLARALEVEVVELDLLSEDYFENMHTIADSLEGSFAK